MTPEHLAVMTLLHILAPPITLVSHDQRSVMWLAKSFLTKWEIFGGKFKVKQKSDIIIKVQYFKFNVYKKSDSIGTKKNVFRYFHEVIQVINLGLLMIYIHLLKMDVMLKILNVFNVEHLDSVEHPWCRLFFTVLVAAKSSSSTSLEKPLKT